MEPSAHRWLCVAHEWGQRELAMGTIRDLRDWTGERVASNVYSPLIRKTIAQPGRPPIRQIMPCWRGYLAVLVNPDAWHLLTRTRGVAHVLHAVGDRQSPAWIAHSRMDAMLEMTSKAGVVEAWSDPPKLPAIEVGARVRITGGALAGREATVCLSSEARVAVLMDMLGREAKATVERRHVEEIA
jgi:hypothetical protein